METKNADSRWSWGAFMFGVPFLVGIKKYAYLFWYLLVLVPFVNILFIIGFKIYLGVKGYALAAASPQFADDAERGGFMKGLDHAGKVLFFAALILAAAVALFLVFGFGAMFAVLRGPWGQAHGVPMQYH